MTRKVVLAASAAAALGAATPAAMAAFPGTNGPVYFTGPVMTTEQMWIQSVDPAGGIATPLLHEGQIWQHGVEVSPDGRKMVFHRIDAEDSGIWIADVDGTDLRWLSEDHESDAWPSFSPDGKRIVFSAPREDWTPRLMTMAVDGTDRQLVGEGVVGYQPTFSPDGSKIAYTYEEPNRSRYTEVWVVDADGSNRRRIAYGAENADWTPDGTQLVMALDLWGEGYQIGIIRLDAVEVDPTPLVTRPWPVGHPSVSPDGTRVVYQEWPAYRSEQPGLMVMDIDGEHVGPISGTDYGSFPDWAAGAAAVKEEPKTTTTTTTATSTAPAAVTTPSLGVVPVGKPARICASRRNFPIHVPRTGLRSVRIVVNGKLVKAVKRGRFYVAQVDLRQLPKGRFSVRIVKRMRSGDRVVAMRRYRTCVPRPR